MLDAIALLRATRNVAYNHFAIRLSQAELYTKTSSITKAFRQRYPVVTSTISQKFSQSSYDQNDGVPQFDKKPGPQVHATENPGVNQDHHYSRSEKHSAATSEQESIGFKQEAASRQAMPDGSIPPSNSPIGEQVGDVESEYTRPTVEPYQRPLDGKSGSSFAPKASDDLNIPSSKTTLDARKTRMAQRQSEDQIPAISAEPPTAEPEFSIEQEKDVYYQPPGQAEPVLSSLPRVRVPKIENDVQGGDSHLPQNINADVFYSGSEDGPPEPSEEQLSQLFHSPRSARLIGQKEKHSPGGGRRSFHTSSLRLQQKADVEKQDLQQLAQDMAKDVQSSEVCLPDSPP